MSQEGSRATHDRERVEGEVRNMVHVHCHEGARRARASQHADHARLKLRPELTRPDFCSLRPPPRPSHPSRPPCRQHRRREQQKIHQQHPEQQKEILRVSSRERAEKTVREETHLSDKRLGEQHRVELNLDTSLQIGRTDRPEDSSEDGDGCVGDEQTEDVCPAPVGVSALDILLEEGDKLVDEIGRSVVEPGC